MKSLLLLLLVASSLLISPSHAQYGSDEHFTASAEDIAQKFVSNFLGSIRSSDKQKLTEHIDKTMVFNGCDDGYNRSKMVKVLVELSEEKKSNMKVEVKEAHFLTDWDVVFLAEVNGVECAFILKGGRQILVKGEVRKCPERKVNEKELE